MNTLKRTLSSYSHPGGDLNTNYFLVSQVIHMKVTMSFVMSSVPKTKFEMQLLGLMLSKR
jgi:hypothetical protein